MSVSPLVSPSPSPTPIDGNLQQRTPQVTATLVPSKTSDKIEKSGTPKTTDELRSLAENFQAGTESAIRSVQKFGQDMLSSAPEFSRSGGLSAAEIAFKPAPAGNPSEDDPDAAWREHSASAADRAEWTKSSAKDSQDALVHELVQSGMKVTPSEVVAAEKLPSGKIVFLEQGNAQSGLQHIVAQHGKEFAQKGVSEDKIPGFIMAALKSGKVVGQQGKSDTRPIYEFKYEGQTLNVAITTGSNGYIVGANIP